MIRMQEKYVLPDGTLNQVGYSALRGTESALDALTVRVSAAETDITTLEGNVQNRSSVSATTSGGAVDITGIPTTAVAITLHLKGVSLSGTDDFLVQFLDSGGSPITSGYVSSAGTFNDAAASAVTSSTSGFVVRSNNFATMLSGRMEMTRFPGTTDWAQAHTFKRTTAGISAGGGDCATGGNVTGIRITRTGADTFDAGSIFAEWRS